VTGSGDTTARIWDAATGAEIACLNGHGSSVIAATFSPDGTRIVTASADETARIWDAASGAEIACLNGHEDPVYTAAFSPDGTRIVTASRDKTARIWDAASGAEIACLNGHEDAVITAAFSPDGTRIVTGSHDTTARIWDVATGAEIACLKGHESYVSTAAFSPDGTRIVTASADETARIWDVAWTSAVKFGVHALLASAVQFGVGKRTPEEAEDLLMQDAPEDMFASLCAIPNKDGLTIDPTRVAEATDLLWHRQGTERSPRPFPPPSGKATPSQNQRRRLPILATFFWMSLACAALAGVAAAAVLWGPNVGLPWAKDLLSLLSK
jgi:dipeptidyl aminopeptidase/acylaminoacyl peptidase